MGFVSYSEDILKRHQSDMHDLMRELEEGHLSAAKQARVLPQFAALLRGLRDILFDPNQPAAMRLIELRHRERQLTSDVEQYKLKNQRLAATNTELNARALRLKSDMETLRADLKSVRRDCQDLEGRIEALKAEISERDARLTESQASIRKLEQMAMAAQVDRRI